MLSDQTILIVDDQSLVRKVIKSMLAGKNCQSFLEAANGLEAETIMHSSKPTLVICDINMSPGDGFDFLFKVRSGDFGNKATPVILLTSNIDPQMVERAERNGANGYLLKPISADDLTAEIENVLKNYWQKYMREHPHSHDYDI